MEKIIVIGAGDCADLIFDSIDPDKEEIVGFVDEYRIGKHLGKPILGTKVEEVQGYTDYGFIISIAEPAVRKRLYKSVKALGVRFVNVIDPTAIVSKTAAIGEGNYIGKGTVINAFATIGNNNMIVSTAIIEHHAVIHNHTRIAPGAVINGNVIMEDAVFAGSNSCFIGDQKIGTFSIIGAGAVVLGDVPERATYVGVPARRIK